MKLGDEFLEVFKSGNILHFLEREEGMSDTGSVIADRDLGLDFLCHAHDQRQWQSIDWSTHTCIRTPTRTHIVYPRGMPSC